MSQRLTVIMYHYVRELPYTRYPEIKALLTTEFKEQLAYLKKHYTFVTVSDCLSALQNEHDLPSDACLLTFDDGYIDHFITVFPILEENEIQGCFFPPAKAIPRMATQNPPLMATSKSPTLATGKQRI